MQFIRHLIDEFKPLVEEAEVPLNHVLICASIISNKTIRK
jgi:hypothetical protein